MQAVICYYTLAFGLNPEIFSKVAKLLAILVAKKLKPSSVPANFTKRLTKVFLQNKPLILVLSQYVGIEMLNPITLLKM